MLVFRPWLKPAAKRGFQAAEAWEGAARAIRTAAQTAASAAEGADLPSPYGGLTNTRPAPRSVRVEARRRRRAVAQHHRVELLEGAVVGRVPDQVVKLPGVVARVVELL